MELIYHYEIQKDLFINFYSDIVIKTLKKKINVSMKI